MSFLKNAQLLIPEISHLTCRPLLIIIIIALLLLLGSLLGQTMNTYLYKDYFNNTKILSLVSLASMLPMILCAPFATKLSDKFGKKRSARRVCW